MDSCFDFAALPVRDVAFAEESFAAVSRLVDEEGGVLLLKNGQPRYALLAVSGAGPETPAEDAEALEISRKLIERNRQAYTELSK
jgi:antitoxin Phd